MGPTRLTPGTRYGMAGAAATDITDRVPGDSDTSSPLSVLGEGEHLPRIIEHRTTRTFTDDASQMYNEE